MPSPQIIAQIQIWRSQSTQ